MFWWGNVLVFDKRTQKDERAYILRILKFEAIVDFLKWSQSLAKGFFCHSFDIHEIWLICFSYRLNMIGTKAQYWNRQLIN